MRPKHFQLSLSYTHLRVIYDTVTVCRELIYFDETRAKMEYGPPQQRKGSIHTHLKGPDKAFTVGSPF